MIRVEIISSTWVHSFVLPACSVDGHYALLAINRLLVQGSLHTSIQASLAGATCQTFISH